MKIDKSKWEIKKIGEVCKIISGSTPRTQESKNWTNGTYCWITPAELKGNKLISDTERKISDYAVKHTNLTLMPIGTVLLSSRAPIGKVAITTVPMYCNQGFKNLTCSELIYNEFLYYYLKSQTKRLNYLGNGVTFKEISRKIVQDIKIPVPPIKEQQAIAEEFDTLQSLITQYREQLNEYDKLAQSIFHEMFGDVVTNEKGWKNGKLNEICNEITSSKRIFAKEYKETGIPFYRIKEIIEKSKGLRMSVELYISEERYTEIKEKFCIPQKGDILITAVGSIGYSWVVDTDTPFYFKDGNVLWIKMNANQNSIFVKYMLEVLMNEFKKKLSNGAAYQAMTINKLEELEINKVPLPLQQQFASRIESIEAQKALVKQQLSDVQTLFDSRMQYYFD